MAIKKTVTIEGVRSWTGPMENYEAHKECVEHWCGGGDVEFFNTADEWINLPYEPPFNLDVEYRVKRREPKQGEIWLNSDGLPEMKLCKSENRHDWAVLTGGIAWHSAESISTMTYAAPSVGAYIAKQIIKEIGNNTAYAYNVLCEKAGEE